MALPQGFLAALVGGRARRRSRAATAEAAGDAFGGVRAAETAAASVRLDSGEAVSAEGLGNGPKTCPISYFLCVRGFPLTIGSKEGRLFVAYSGVVGEVDSVGK